MYSLYCTRHRIMLQDTDLAPAPENELFKQF